LRYCYILTKDYQPILNTAEVATLFSHPLASFMSELPPFPTESELVEVPYHTANDFTYPGPNDTTCPARVHRFLTGREAGGIKPVFGLTACVPSLVILSWLTAYNSTNTTPSAILIRAACIAHAPRLPDFEVTPPGAQTPEQRIAWAVFANPSFREAYEAEKLRVDWASVRKTVGVEAPRTTKEEVHAHVHSRRRQRTVRNKL
jgi:coenzyme A diphosphatase NUDT7